MKNIKKIVQCFVFYQVILLITFKKLFVYILTQTLFLLYSLNKSFKNKLAHENDEIKTQTI